MPIAVAVIVKGDKVLLGHRVSEIEEWRKWELPGGKIKEGETLEEAALREVREELGVECEVVAQIPFVYSNLWELPNQKIHVVLMPVLLRIVEGEPKPLEGLDDVGWFTLEQIAKLDCLPGTWEIVKAAFEFLSETPRDTFVFEGEKTDI